VTAPATSLLDLEHKPKTQTFGLIARDLQQVQTAFRRWARIGGEVEFRPVEGTLSEMLAQLGPSGGPLTARLFVEADQWTAIFDNSSGGGDPSGVLGNLALRDAFRGVLVAHQPEDPPDGAWGHYAFHIYDRAGELGFLRTLSAIKDEGGWEWDEFGEQQPFEQPEFYQRRRIRDRLPLELLIEYCAAMGAHPFDVSWYGSRGLIVTTTPRRSRSDRPAPY